MAYKLPSALGNILSDCPEEIFVELPGDLNAERAVRSRKTFFVDSLPEFAGKTVEYAHLSVARPEAWLGQQIRRSQWKAGAKRIADRANSASGGRAKQRAQHRGKKMGVLMRVHMRDGNSGRLNLSNLCGGFPFDLI